MKLPIAEENEVRQVYDTWLKSYLNGDIKVYDSYLDPEYRFIGSTDNEVFLNKKDTTNFLKATADQLAGKAEVRNSVKTVEKLGDLVFITELFDAYFLNDAEWAYYGRFRFTSALRKKKNGWRFVYQHFSMPDAKAQEGETLGTEQITKENQELRDAIKRRTVELEQKNRELQIEAALEKVRSRSMAMHNSEELSDVIAVVSEQLQQLKIRFDHVSFAINSEAEDYHFWTALYGKPKPYELKVPYLDHPVANRAKEVRAKGLNFYQDTLTPEENRRWLEHAFKYNPADYLSAEEKAYVMSRGFSRSFALMPNILLAVGNYASKPYSEEDNEIIKRFAGVFEQSYTRFLDLQKAEAQARESQVEAALERVRAKSMAMHKSEELAELSLELVKQVQALGVATWFCAFNIYDDDPKGSLEWGSNGQGTFPRYRTPREGIFLRYYEAGKRGETLMINEIGKDECPAHYDYLCTLPGVGEQLLQMKEAGISFPKSQIDHVAFFKYGYILFITYEPVPESHDIFKRFAKVFEQTYTRFLDLQKAEELAKQAQIDLENLIDAKKKTDEALTELKATQSQLIQSEKMASLGELTAGIAHEIQNPLNFVNNFSEVSNELIDEMKEEFEKGDKDEAFAIADDIKQNLAKIHHHGQRADAIVKGMLQHSRSSSGVKEPTDINALCDEYLRLAYHGLRAKDKTFNATLNTAFDPTIGKVNVVPQDMGRVILNLITNAFYAVTERKNAPLPPAPIGVVTYEPTVTVSTKRLPPPIGAGGGTVEISVKDNGNGIPQKVLDKIFQPFFTTKPTGQGTGLGLSMSYDILTKGHGGKITVESKEGQGTEFSINLPIL
ncbi:MAG: ATP-binding protein [Flavobacteriaceae bacterium]